MVSKTRLGLRTDKQVLRDQLKDPELRAAWERTALARAIALKVTAYRATHGLSQTALAKRLDMRQPAVARLELGEHNPTIEMLVRLSRVLDIEIVVDIAPARRKKRLVTKRAETKDLIEHVRVGTTSVLVASS